RYELDQMADRYSAFVESYPSFNQTALLDEWREDQYSRLDANGQIYLDYTGGGLYSESQLCEHMELLRTSVLGNPHSANPTSLAMTDLVEDTRKYALRYFSASPDEYIAIFTANASGALKLVGEAYPFTPASHYILTFDNHNSVNGIREFAKVKGAQVTYVPLTKPDLRIERTKLDDILNLVDMDHNNLFAFPAQSNFSGVKHPLDLIELAHSKGVDVLLDAAAYVPTSRLDLSVIKPEFVVISFYKMFGYP
ncbi:MAG: aminotransferase class V-fold PLP-dependent enzyme, partial [Hyphomicrobiales bacterium]|nr:aminotransferase class V-fold PLP-dependent enzyme [Hyphomicrobiales bacterium]